MNAPQKFVRKDLVGGSVAGGASTETFALEVTGYDLKVEPNVVKGKRLDTGEEVSVYLREINNDAKRPSVAQFAAKKKKITDPSTSVGGIVLAEKAYKEPSGDYAARWIRCLSPEPGVAEVMTATATVSPSIKSKNGKAFRIATLILDNKADTSKLSEEMQDALKIIPPFEIKSADDLRDSLTEMFDNGINAGVRIYLGDTFDVRNLYAPNGKSTKEVIDRFISALTAKNPNAEIGKEMRVEIIPMPRVFMGPSALESLEKNEQTRKQINGFSESVEVPAQNGKAAFTRDVPVFMPAILAVRFHENASPDGTRGAYFTHIEPLKTAAPVKEVKEALAVANTDIYSPEPIAPAAQEAEEDDSEFDDTPDDLPEGIPFDDTNIMAGLDDDDDVPTPDEITRAARAAHRLS